MSEAPYLRIVRQIRDEIDGGRLRPGDRVPSARQITGDWGVAIATATKVLATLRTEGLVEVVRGVGTVVAGTDRGFPATPVRKRRDTAEPTREQVVRRAIELADAEGLHAVSMRRLATELNLPTMSVYRYIGGKDDLLRHMMDAVFGQAPLPPAPPAGVRPQLALAYRALWEIYRRHPWLAPAMSLTRPELAPNGMRYTEWVLRALEPLDLPVSRMMQIHLSLFAFVRGLAMGFETEAEAAQHTGMSSDEWMTRQEPTLAGILASGRFPMIAKVAEVDEVDVGLDAVFEFGLPRMLDGLLGGLG